MKTPICQSSAFEQEHGEELAKIFENKMPRYCYTRVANPTVTAFEDRMTKLEGGIKSVVFASGMAAIFNSFFQMCNRYHRVDNWTNTSYT